jgi:hypothetical protein
MDWEFADDAEGYSDDFWYDINFGGHIRPEELLTNPEQLKALKDAVELVKSYEAALTKMGFLY